MIEHYSHKIQNAIQKELFKANKSIKVAVAWFTNDLLFQPLLLKLASGVSVEIILNKDEINCSDENEIDFDEFVNAGGILRWNDTKQLLHDKFCIIDDMIVIYGSYNWTNKAEYNEESITIARDEENTINFYLDKFSKLSQKYPISQKVLRGSPSQKFTTEKDNSRPSSKTKKILSSQELKKDRELLVQALGRMLQKEDPTFHNVEKESPHPSEINCKCLHYIKNKGFYKILPDIKEIANKAFFGFEQMKQIEMASVKKIGYESFKGCKSLRLIKMPCIEEIDSYAFANCISLCDINLPNGIKIIRPYAFSGCTSLIDVNIPDSISHLDWSVFEGSKNLRQISVSELAKVTDDYDTQYYLTIKKRIRRKIMVPTSSPIFNDEYKKKGGLMMTLAEKNDADAKDVHNKRIYYDLFRACPPFKDDFFLYNFTDGEIITIPDNYAVFRRQIKEQISLREEVIYEYDYINAINSDGYIVELHPNVMCAVYFEVDNNGRNIRENGRMKISRTTGTVGDFLRSRNFKNINEGLKEMTGCLIKVSFLKRVLIRKFGVPESTATSKDVIPRDVYDFSFVGERRPIGFVEKNNIA